MAASQKVALVTGAGTGIGKAVALALMREGYAVTLAGRRADKLKETESEGRSTNGKSLVMPTDVSDPASVKAAFAATKQAFGRLDILFNNAGIGAPAMPMEDLPLETWRKVVDTNLTGMFLCTQEAIRLMKSQDPRGGRLFNNAGVTTRGVPLEELTVEQWKAVVDVNLTGAFLCTQQAFVLMKDQQPQGGRIINNGSISAYSPRPHSAPYTATKHAVTGLTKQTALDCRGYDITCSQIDIGNAATPLTERMVQGQGVLQPDGRSMVEPRMNADDVGRAVVYIAGLPLDTNVLFMTVMANLMPFVGRG